MQALQIAYHIGPTNKFIFAALSAHTLFLEAKLLHAQYCTLHIQNCLKKSLNVLYCRLSVRLCMFICYGCFNSNSDKKFVCRSLSLVVNYFAYMDG